MFLPATDVTRLHFVTLGASHGGPCRWEDTHDGSAGPGGDLDEADAGLCGQLAALGVRRVDAAERAGPGLLTVAAAARAAGERVLICVGADTVPEPVLARLLGAGGTAAFTGVNAGPPAYPADGRLAAGSLAAGALVVDPPDLDALAQSAESLAATHAGPAPVGALIGELTDRGIRVRILDTGPDSEGAVAQLLADPAARDMARWAAWRKLTPAAMYGISLGLGLVAAVWFAELAVLAKLVAIAALAGSFLFARAGSLLAATSREGRIRPAVAWLGAACGLLTELAVYAAPGRQLRLAVSSGLAPGRPQAGVAGLDGPSATRCRTPPSPAGAASARPACGGWPSQPCWSWPSAGWPSSATSTRPCRRGSCSPGRCCAPWSRPSPSRPVSGSW